MLPRTLAPVSKASTKRCYQCDGRFGLVRHRLVNKAFCSKQCLGTYKADAERRISRIKDWVDFLARKL